MKVSHTVMDAMKWVKWIGKRVPGGVINVRGAPEEVITR